MIYIFAPFFEIYYAMAGQMKRAIEWDSSSNEALQILVRRYSKLLCTPSSLIRHWVYSFIIEVIKIDPIMPSRGLNPPCNPKGGFKTNLCKIICYAYVAVPLLLKKVNLLSLLIRFEIEILK